MGMPDFLFYLEFEMVIWRFTFTSRKEIKPFFITFHCTYILRKETDLECRERRFCLVCRERQFCAVGGNFAIEGDLQILSIVKDKSCDFFVSLKNTKYNRKERKRDLTSQEIVGTRSDRRS